MLPCLQAFKRFLEQRERSPHTIKHYLSDLSDFAVWFEQTNEDVLTPEKITPTDLREYKRELVMQRKLKPNTVNRKLATLRAFLKWANQTVSAETVAPSKVPRPEKQIRPGPRWLDRREQNALLRAVERHHHVRDMAIVKVLLNTGLRVQELCDLTWQDVFISPRTGMLTVRRGKGGKRRQVPLNADARRALLDLGYVEHIGMETPIFLGQRGPLTPRGVQFALARYASALRIAAGRETLSPHLLRHTFCKNLVVAGVDLPRVAALAGHETLETTRRYCEPSLKDLERAVELISEDA